MLWPCWTDRTRENMMVGAEPRRRIAISGRDEKRRHAESLSIHERKGGSTRLFTPR